MMDDNIAIKVEGLTKVYPIYNKKNDRLKEALNIHRKKYHTDFYALKDVSFVVNKGETVGIIGINGAGKSTLLKILTGVLNPTIGSAAINGKVSALLELGAGFNPEMTGKENIYLNGTIMGYTREEMKQKVSTIVEFADIGDFINQPVKMYSSGMYVRLAFAVAINVEPDILIIDEALAVGDAIFQRKCFTKIEELKNKNITIVFVSHDKSSVLELCDTCILLNKGLLIKKGKSNAVIKLYDKLINLTPNEQIQYIENLTNDMSKTEESGQIDSKAGVYSNSIFWDAALNVNKPIQYKNNGAEIFKYGLEDNLGRTVNILKKNSKYYWKYSVKFLEDVKSVNFGMLIKTQKGIEIAGRTAYPINSQGKSVKKGDILTVNFEFAPNLNFGIYFLNCGVFTTDRGFHYLDRRMDTFAFRIEKDFKQYATGIVDLLINCDIEEEFD